MISINYDTQLILIRRGFGVLLVTGVEKVAGGGARSIVGAAVLLVMLYILATINEPAGTVRTYDSRSPSDPVCNRLVLLATVLPGEPAGESRCRRELDKEN